MLRRCYRLKQSDHDYFAPGFSHTIYKQPNTVDPVTDTFLYRTDSLLQSGIVALHGTLSELGAGDQWVLLQGTLDLAVGVGLIEESEAIPGTEIVDGRVHGSLDTVEGGFKAVVAPGHEDIATVENVRPWAHHGGGVFRETYMLQTISPVTGSTLVHTSPLPNSVNTSRPGQISNPL